MNPFVTKIISRVTMLVILFSGIIFFQNCQNSSSPNVSLTAKDSFLFGSETKILFDCTPQGLTGSAWLISWTPEGISYSYSHVSPSNTNPTTPKIMKLVSKSTPPSDAVGGGPVEIWTGSDFNLRLWTFPSPEAPFASITAIDGTQTSCSKVVH